MPSKPQRAPEDHRWQKTDFTAGLFSLQKHYEIIPFEQDFIYQVVLTVLRLQRYDLAEKYTIPKKRYFAFSLSFSLPQRARILQADERRSALLAFHLEDKDALRRGQGKLVGGLVGRKLPAAHLGCLWARRLSRRKAAWEFRQKRA